MKIEEIIRLEDANEQGIILLKEGMFWRAYERSAFWFVRLIQEYRAMVKYFKNVDQRMVFWVLLGKTFTETKKPLAGLNGKWFILFVETRGIEPLTF